MADLGRVRDKLAALSAYREELRCIDADDERSTARFSRRYLVQAGIQVCIDLANHLVASEGWRTATDFRDAFTRLAEHGARLRAMVGMRNRLVHLYDDVDDAPVARVVDENFGDRDAFARAFAGRLTRGDRQERP